MTYLLLIFLVFCELKTSISRPEGDQYPLLSDKTSQSYQNTTRVEDLECGVFQTPSQFVNNITCSDDSSCPPWFQCHDNACKCGAHSHHMHMICCNDQLQQSAVLDCHCMTHDEKTQETVAGACFYNCVNATRKGADTIYHLLPSNISSLNEVMCGHLNRTGPLCGECVSGSYPLAYSYNMSCVYCPDGHKNWWKFILAALFPLTLFNFLVLFFKINATSSHFHGYVLLSQVVSVPAFIRNILRARITHINPSLVIAVKTAVTFYGIWNLDFFRTLLPDICLQTNTLQTLALDYVIAVYPLFLMILSYVLIELYDRNFKVVVFLWKPFRFVLAFFRRNWDSRTSVIDAYATFFLLSSIKFLSVSFDLLVPTRLYKQNSNQSSLVLYYDGSIEYFGKEHRPYAILAITILVIFTFLPVALLLLYPFRLFQKFLNCMPYRCYIILHTFVDAFQGCYKDGTEPGTRDCRWFAALFLIWRMASFVVYALTLGSAFTEAAILLYLILAVLLVIVQPFKARVSHFNKINVTFILLICMLYASIAGMDIAFVKVETFFKIFVILAAISTFIPLVYVTYLVVHWIFSKRKWGMQFVQRIQAVRQGYNLWKLEEHF